MHHRLALVVLIAGAPGCELLGFYSEEPTECPEEIACCSADDPLANEGCDWTCNDPAAPDFLLTAVRPTAGQPISAVFRAAIEDAVASGGLTWLFDVSAGGGTTHFRGGSADCTPSGSCTFDGELPPAEGDASLGREGRLSLPAAGTFDTVVRLAAADLGRAIDLPLRECTLTGPVESAGNCIGRRRSTSAGDWSTPGRLACEISANEAAEIDLTALNLTLCDLLAGCGSVGCCDGDERQWPNAPDERVGGFPSWRVQADVAAIGVRVEE